MADAGVQEVGATTATERIPMKSTFRSTILRIAVIVALIAIALRVGLVVGNYYGLIWIPNPCEGWRCGWTGQ